MARGQSRESERATLLLICSFACLLASSGSAATLVEDADPTYEEGDGVIPLPAGDFARLPKTASYRAYLPDRADLSKGFPAPGDQGAARSCTAWAVGYAARAYYAAVAEGRDIRDPANIPSPSYIFGSIVSDPHSCRNGAKIVDALDLLKDKGAESIKSYPYSAKACRAPTAVQRAGASDFKISNWLAIDYTHPDQLKAELTKRHPVIISIRDTKTLHKLRGSEIYEPTSSATVGWHALVVVGYDERKQAFRVINSWGPRWGDHGFGWLSYAAVPSEINEAYAMRPLAPIAESVATVPPAPDPSPTPRQQPPQPDKPIAIALASPDSCSKLTAVKSATGMSFKFWGFTDSKARLAEAQPKADQSQVQERPWPQCEVLQTLGGSLSKSDGPSVKVQSEAGTTKGGVFLKFVVKSPSFPSFLHVAYLQADGSVVNLLQPSSMTLHAYPPNSTVVLGDPASGGPTFHVDQPYGREMLIVTASRSPLFDAPLPDAQNARDFLTDLRKALIARPDQSSPNRLVTAGFDSMITSEKGIVSVPAPSGM